IRQHDAKMGLGSRSLIELCCFSALAKTDASLEWATKLRSDLSFHHGKVCDSAAGGECGRNGKAADGGVSQTAGRCEVHECADLYPERQCRRGCEVFGSRAPEGHLDGAEETYGSAGACDDQNARGTGARGEGKSICGGGRCGWGACARGVSIGSASGGEGERAAANRR